MKFSAHWIVGTLMLVSLAGPAAVFAQPGGDFPPPLFGVGPGTGGPTDVPQPPILRGVDLTEAQQDKVFEILHAQAPVLHKQTKALRKAEDELHKLAASSDFSEAKARNLAEVAAKASAEIGFILVKTDHQLFEILTAEQRERALAGPHRISGQPALERKPRVWRE